MWKLKTEWEDCSPDLDRTRLERSSDLDALEDVISPKKRNAAKGFGRRVFSDIERIQ